MKKLLLVLGIFAVFFCSGLVIAQEEEVPPTEVDLLQYFDQEGENGKPIKISDGCDELLEKREEYQKRANKIEDACIDAGLYYASAKNWIGRDFLDKDKITATEGIIVVIRKKELRELEKKSRRR